MAVLHNKNVRIINRGTVERVLESPVARVTTSFKLLII